MCARPKGHCNLPQWTRCSWSICYLLSGSHCFIFLRAFQGKVWKHHSRSQRRGFFQYPQSSGSHPLNCSPHNHIKRFRKELVFIFLLLLCFSSAEQCPSATGSHNSLPVCAQRTSTPHPALAISFSSSGPGPLPHLHPIVWAKAARAGLGPVQTYSSLSLDDCQYSLKSVNFVTLQIRLTVAFCWCNKKKLHSLTYREQYYIHLFPMCHVACWDSFAHVRRCNKIPIHHAVPKVGQASVCLSPSPVRKEGWSVFSGRTPFGWGSAPPYWPLCGSLIELSCQRAARSQCRVHYVIQTHSGAPREVLGSADNGTAPSSNTQKSVASLSPHCPCRNKENTRF